MKIPQLDDAAIKAATETLMTYGLHRDWAKRYATQAVSSYLSLTAAAEPPPKAEEPKGWWWERRIKMASPDGWVERWVSDGRMFKPYEGPDIRNITPLYPLTAEPGEGWRDIETALSDGDQK